jgi:hypothetical protein
MYCRALRLHPVGRYLLPFTMATLSVYSCARTSVLDETERLIGELHCDQTGEAASISTAQRLEVQGASGESLQTASSFKDELQQHPITPATTVSEEQASEVE